MNARPLPLHVPSLVPGPCRWPLVALGAAIAALSGGCGSEPAGPTQSSTTTGEGGTGTGTGGATTTSSSNTGGSGGSMSCEPGSHVGTSGGCEATITGWTTGPSLMQKRDHHATMVAVSPAGAFLYVIGGVQDNTVDLDTVEFAPLAADGSVGAFAAGTKLPETMAGHGIATVGSTVVVGGGYRTGPVLSKKTEYTTIQADGTLAPWKSGPQMSIGRFHTQMIAHKDSIYVVGGLTGNNTDSTPKVERLVVSGEGVLGTWSQLTPLPKQRSHHGLAVWEGALYVTAGLTGNPAGAHEDFKDVLRAPINDDGTIGEWATVGELPVTLGTHSSFAHLGYLYVLSGVENNASNTKHVRRAPIGADGMVGTWEDLPQLPKAHAHAHHTPLHAGYVYSAGGALNHLSTTDVFVGKLE